ncbi:MAG: ROK family transcriptional regulator [Lachnospiraceae bacterium]|nr:ROK family transcriptional regulator [Lachnospiraceae bacterium]
MSMKYQGINLGNVKLSNRSSILRLINNHGAMSRKDIAEAVGLTAASVTLICTDLIDEGVLVEIGEAEEEKRAGRKKILVDINGDYRNVLCIAIETDETFITVTDLKGQVICTHSMPTKRGSDPAEFLCAVAEEARRLMWENDITKERILGVSVTLPGLVERARGLSLNTYNIWTKKIPVAEIIRQELGFTVVVENNLKAAAQSEIYFGFGRHVPDLFLLKWGPGVGSAVIIDGKLYQGANGMAGEIGHMTSNKNGRSCNCGRKGCLETYVSTHAILEDIFDSLGNSDEYRVDLNRLAGDEVRGIMDEKLDLLAHHLRNTVSILDPERVVLTGYMFDIPGFLTRFTDAYREYDDSVQDDFFVKAHTTGDSKHIEGLAVVMEELFF